MKDFLKGLRYPLQGFSYITRPGIRLYIIIPLLVNSLLFLLVIFYGVHKIMELGDWMSSRWGWAGWTQWFLWPLFAIISVTMVFFCFTLVANLISAPFNGFLSASVERALGSGLEPAGATWDEMPAQIITAILNELGKLAYFLIHALPLLVLFIIPVVNVTAPLIWILFSSWLISLEYMDFPMSNQGMTFKQIRRQLQGHRALCTGFGVATLTMTMIPFVNFLAMPVAVISATKLWYEQIRQTVNA